MAMLRLLQPFQEYSTGKESVKRENGVAEKTCMTRDKIRGALLGAAVGDALGMPVEGFNHQNVRMYYKGIKEYRDDEKRGDLKAGQWTDDTQLTFAIVQVLTEQAEPHRIPALVTERYVALAPQARRWGPTTRAAIERLAAGKNTSDLEPLPSNGAAMRAGPLGVWWAAGDASYEAAFAFMEPIFAVTHRHPASVAAGFAQAFAVRESLRQDLNTFDPADFWRKLTEVTLWVEQRLGGSDQRVSARLQLLEAHLDEFPLDLLDLCDGAGIHASESWPFAAAMFARRPELLEPTLLSTINVGGDADTTGAMTGALLGALHGWAAFPEAWRDGLESVRNLEAQADAYAHALGGAS